MRSFLFAVIASGMLSGCIPTHVANVADSYEKVEQSITYDYDTFGDVYTLSSESFKASTDIPDNGHFIAGVHYKLYSVAKAGEKPRTVRLETQVVSQEWYFIKSAYGEDHNEMRLKKVDREVLSQAGMVLETYRITIPISMLADMSEKDYKIQLRGSRGNIVMTVPRVASMAFLDAIDSRRKTI